MQILPFSFQIFDWSTVPKEIHNGEKEFATWQVLNIGQIRVRKLVYAAGYKADHWCSKGHIIHCLKGELMTELKDGRKMVLKSGMTYIVGDDCEAHLSQTEKGCELFVVD